MYVCVCVTHLFVYVFGMKAALMWLNNSVAVLIWAVVRLHQERQKSTVNCEGFIFC